MVSGCLYSIGVGPGDPELIDFIKSGSYNQQMSCFGFCRRRAAKSVWLIRSQDRFCRK